MIRIAHMAAATVSRRLRRTSLLVRFAVVSLVLVLALGIVLADRVGAGFERATLDSSARMIGSTTQFVLGSGLVGPSSQNPLALQRSLSRALHSAGLRDRILQVRAVLPNGATVFSTEAGLLGRRAAIPSLLRTAVRSGVAARVVRPGDPGAGSASYPALLRRQGALVEVYVRVRMAGTPFPNIVAIYVMPYAPLVRTASAQKRTIFAVLGVGLAVLWLALFRLVATASRRLRRQARENRHQALHDSLTGLPNRALLGDRVERAAALAARGDTSSAVLLLDLDRFKEVNDTLGHAYGDGLLVQVAERLTAELRESDTAARLGGDEFAVLAVDVRDAAHAEELAGRLLQALRRPFQQGSVTLDVEASIGIALAPAHGTDIETLLRCADVAMYTAKRGNLGAVCYDGALDDNTPARLTLLGDLRRALDAGDQLILHYQPKVDLVSGRLAGVEALVRWQHPERGLVPPGEFIPAAESTALIHALTDQVLDRALAQTRRWTDAGHPVEVAVNVSTRCLLDTGLPDRVRGMLERHGLPARQLRIEITEATLMADPARALTVLNALHAAGVGISVDDFGTGYSSMNYLQRLPVDELKVDRSFIFDMQDGEQTNVLLRSVVDLGHNLGLRVVAEGVEEHVTLTAISRLGCDIAQGFYLGRPMPPEALTERIASGLAYLPDDLQADAA